MSESDKIIVFKNGERVICELQEAFEGEGEERRGICLIMRNPYILELVPAENPTAENDLQVKFSKWCPYSIDYQFRVPYDSILAIGIPDQGLDGAYRQKIASRVAQQDNELPKWEEGQTNPNMEAQLAEITEVVGVDAPPTAGVAGNTDQHPIATPLAQEESDAETPEN